MADGKRQNSGGAAAAGGIRFQAEVGALLAVHALTEWPLEQEWGFAGEIPAGIFFETNAPVDDILVETNAGHRLYVQAKTRLSLSKDDRGGLNSCFDQAVRLLLASRSEPTNPYASLDLTNTRIVFATGDNAPQSVRVHLTKVLARAGMSGSLPAVQLGLANQDENTAFEFATGAIRDAFQRAGSTAADDDVLLVLQLVRIVSIATDVGGSDRRSTLAQLGNITESPSQNEAALDVLVAHAEDLMRKRSGALSAAWRQQLMMKGIPLRAAPSFVDDVRRIKSFSDSVLTRLRSHEAFNSQGAEVRVARQSVKDIVAAAQSGHLLIIGEPGAGKSGAMASAADLLAKDSAVIALAVDELAVSDLDSLRTAIGLEHPIVEVLANIPTTDRGYLFIDALDASRGGPSEQAIVSLIGRVMDDVKHWTVVASVREFDLRLGKRYQTAFRGAPPVKEAASLDFPDVRHVRVPLWTPEEFASVCAQAPKINDVVSGAAAGLKDVLRVPFNTRLAGELVDAGITPAAFHVVSGQVELLDLYWRERVQHLGPSADATIQLALKSMVERHQLRCDASVVAGIPDYQSVFSINLLILVSDGRFAAFRHHLLFDYAVSRYLLNYSSDEDFKFWTDREREAGLLLGPGCSFTLARLWTNSGSDRANFWRVCLALCGGDGIDPIIRVVAGRSAAEHPQAPTDTEALTSLVLGQSRPELKKGVRTIVSSLISLTDENHPRAPWISFAQSLPTQPADFLFSSRALLMWALKQAGAQADASVGTLARAVLNTAINTSAPSTQVVVPSIEAVATTYTTDPTASRETLQRLLEENRLAERAHDEIPWLARQIESIFRADAQFAVQIYATAFDHEVRDSRETQMGDSRILPLMSSTRQDYQMSRWSLTEAFPEFLAAEPEHAVFALVAALRGTIRREHKLPEKATLQTIKCNGREYAFQEDLSYIWASDPNDPHARDAEKMLQLYVSYLRSLDVAKSQSLIDRHLPTIEFAVLWARTLMVCADHPQTLGAALFGLARHPTILHCNDTKKDAIDVIGVVLATHSPIDQEAILKEIFEQDYSIYNDPDVAKQSVQRRLRSVIARRGKAPEPIRDPDDEEAEPLDLDEEGLNTRLVRHSGWVGRGRDDDEWWWMTKDGVDVKAEPNASLLSHAKALSDFLDGQKEDPNEDAAADIATRIEALMDLRATNASSAADRVLYYSDDALARAAGKILDGDEVGKWPRPRKVARTAALLAAKSVSPVIEDVEADNNRENISWGSPAPRLEAAQAIIALGRLSDELDPELRTEIDRLLVDRSVAVRDQVAVRLSYLWDVDREWMWSLARRVASTDRSAAVLRYFATSFLPRVLNSAPTEVEELVTALHQRVSSEARYAIVREDVAKLSAWLWVGHKSPPSQARIDGWLQAIDSHAGQIEDCIEFLRGEFVIGLGEDDARKNAIRHNTHDLAKRALIAAAKGLDEHMAAPDLSSEGMERARSYAKLIDAIGMQLYFSFLPRGDLGKRNPSAPAALFLSEVKPLLALLAENGTPHTTHQLLELLEALVDTAPEDVWDLIAAAILKGGRKHGYAAESMGVDLYVRLVGRYLADYKAVFDNAARRNQLLDTVEAFNDMGWPSARKLLNELPELLR